MFRRLTLLATISLLLPIAARAELSCSTEGDWSENYPCVNDPGMRPTRMDFDTCRMAVAHCTSRCDFDGRDATFRLDIELSMILEEGCRNESGSSAFSELQRSLVATRSADLIDEEALEQWIGRLVGRLSQRWPWFEQATAGQIRFAAQIIVFVVEALLQDSAGSEPTARTMPRLSVEAIERIVLEVMKPERVQ